MTTFNRRIRRAPIMPRRSARPAFTFPTVLPSAIAVTILTLGPLPSPTVPMPGDPALDPLAPLGSVVGTDVPAELGGMVRDAP